MAEEVHLMLKAGMKVKRVWVHKGKEFILGGPENLPGKWENWYVKEMTIEMENGQMAPVPWIKMVDSFDAITMINCATVILIELLKEE